MRTINILLIVILVYSCAPDKSFNKEIWLANDSLEDMYNPRTRMINDLEENILKIGMTKKEIVELLGKPYKDGIEQRLPKGMKTPDSLSLVNTVGKSKVERQIGLDKFNNWYKENSQPDTMLLYPVGWSTIDPNFLAIKFNGDNLVNDFWVENH